MVKKEKTVNKKEEKQPINPGEYGYEQDQKVEIEGNLLLELVEVLNAQVTQNETELKYKVGRDKENKPTLTREIFVTEFGEWANRVITHLANIHKQNAESGVAKKLTDLQAKFKIQPKTKA